MKKQISLYLGPILFLVAVFILPESIPYAIRGAFGTFLWMITWWIFTPLHITITAFLPLVINALFSFVGQAAIVSKYSHSLVFLLIGANLITISWQATGLNKRVALKALSVVGSSVKQQIAIWFVLSTVLSIFLPNIVVAATLSPIALSMLNYVNKGNIKTSLLATNILLAIAWGSGLGGFGTPLGGGMNLVAIGYLEEIIGSEYLFIDWTVRMLPMLFFITIAVLAYLMTLKNEVNKLENSKDFFVEEYKLLGKITSEEIISASLFIFAIVLSFSRPYYANLIPGLNPSFAFLLVGLLTFVLPGKNDGKLLTWNYALPKMNWGLYYLVAGGLALGSLITTSGSAIYVADLITDLNLNGGLITILVFSLTAMLLANVSSNTAACSIAIPIVASITNGLGLNPLPYIYITVASANCAYLLPTSTRAIPIAYGVDGEVMMKKGLMAALISLVVIVVVGWLFINFWSVYSF